MRAIQLLIIVITALVVGVGTGYAASPRIPSGVVNLVVQPDTHFDVTCADGSQIGFVVDGASEGHGYCAPLGK